MNEREQQAFDLKDEIIRELIKIDQCVRSLEHRANRIPIATANPEVLLDFRRKLTSLRIAAEEASIYRII
jgi:hypothetical protein